MKPKTIDPNSSGCHGSQHGGMPATSQIAPTHENACVLAYFPDFRNASRLYTLASTTPRQPLGFPITRP